MRHTKITDTPGKGRDDRNDSAVGNGISCGGIIKFCQGISRQRVGIVHNGTKSTGFADTKYHNGDECNTHNNTLNEVCSTYGAETAH